MKTLISSFFAVVTSLNSRGGGHALPMLVVGMGDGSLHLACCSAVKQVLNPSHCFPLTVGGRLTLVFLSQKLSHVTMALGPLAHSSGVSQCAFAPPMPSSSPGGRPQESGVLLASAAGKVVRLLQLQTLAEGNKEQEEEQVWELANNQE